MKGLTSSLLGRACRIFLTLAYPDGEAAIPPNRRPYLHIAEDQPLEGLLKAPVGQAVLGEAGKVRGYAFRLGSCDYPHLKLKVTDCDDNGTLVFGVDTHDACLNLDPGSPEGARWAHIRASNQRLKEKVEQLWEAEGLPTFNSLLRRQLEQA